MRSAVRYQPAIVFAPDRVGWAVLAVGPSGVSSTHASAIGTQTAFTQQVFTAHSSPVAQSADPFGQRTSPPHEVLPGTQSPPASVSTQTQSGFALEHWRNVVQVAPTHSGLGPGEAANAGVRRLAITGVVHATAPTTPARLSRDRLEIPLAAFSSSVMDAPFAGSIGPIMRSRGDVG